MSCGDSVDHVTYSDRRTPKILNATITGRHSESAGGIGESVSFSVKNVSIGSPISRSQGSSTDFEVVR